jgi:diguanylate cyclase (GGDEF)-like protein
MIRSTPPAIGDVRVLIYEDNATDATLITRFLQKCGVRRDNIQTTDQLPNAVSILSRNAIDICLTDYYLPASTGLDLMDEARRQSIDVPFVMLTAISDPEVDREALSRGAYDFIIKSELTAEGLVRSIRYSLARHKREASLAKAAYHDELSNLPSRNAVLAHLNALATTPPAHGPAVGAVVFVSLNGLKFLNEAYGFKVGGGLLREVARRLRTLTGPDEMVGRVGSDEFACVIAQSDGIADAQVAARRLATAFAQPVRTFDGEHDMSAAIGVTIFPRSAINSRAQTAAPYSALDILQASATAATTAKQTCRMTRSTEIHIAPLH